ncbi:hypothetical protein EAX61_08765 [Dokdonia sinensis]|uniref:Circularly permuted type 2 ATP-grasp protein n=1 Tax=Dokdonia sinensis TaxID=2479847 RepID=A0A3M0G9I8_9FLAO|nr:hypothetical protein [Dokdonia sinensis]RMB59142.1 hypothetical protein EAX61_08765 [Dokdonia sinensis]
MIPSIRKTFNDNFKEEYYEGLKEDTVKDLGEPTAFRISETPVFIPKALSDTIFEACDSIIEQLWKLDFDEIRERFIPKELRCPVPMDKPEFLAIDFGMCEDGNGGITPQLIELQAFPTLFFYQPWLGKTFKKNYPTIPQEGFDYFFSGLNDETYFEELKEVILGDEKPENVILLELFPEKQKTRIDFWATRKALGIEVVCMTKVLKEGRKLYYLKDGKKTPINRIYNRVILDELKGIENFKANFSLTDDLDVKYVSHPDWFFMISKCIVPMLKHKNIPESYYLNDFPADIDLTDYVLKPLFSFAGKGVNLHPDQKTIDAIQDKHNYILQKKVQYASVIETNTPKNSKVELRMLYTWNKEEACFKPVINLTRMSKGELINVSYATEDSWIGSSISFFEK